MRSILAAFLFLAPPAFAGGPLFSQMKDGDTVEVTEKSIGCFHNRVSYYEVARKGDAYSFAIYNITWSDGAPPHQVIKREEVGRMPLSADDVRRLDGMLAFYRGTKDSGCTTVLSIVLEIHPSAGPVTTQKIRDDSGGPYTDKEKQHAATFEEMALRLKRQLSGGGDPSGK